MEGKELNTHQKKKREEKKYRAEKCRCHFPGTSCCRVNAFESRQNSSVVHEWSIRRKWKYFWRWEPWGKLTFFFLSGDFNDNYIRLKNYRSKTVLDIIWCTRMLIAISVIGLASVPMNSEDSFVYCWHYQWGLGIK